MTQKDERNVSYTTSFPIMCTFLILKYFSRTNLTHSLYHSKRETCITNVFFFMRIASVLDSFNLTKTKYYLTSFLHIRCLMILDCVAVLIPQLTLNTLFEMIERPESTKTFSTPPVSFHSMSFLVGGARSKDVTMSEVSDNCSFIVSLGIPFCSSTISLRFLLPFVTVPGREDYS